MDGDWLPNPSPMGVRAKLTAGSRHGIWSLIGEWKIDRQMIKMAQ
jgi:hypothetical protein